MSAPLGNILIVLALIGFEGLFVGAEIALISLRESQVRQLASQGRRGERLAKLINNPNRWLAAVQVGVTLTALLSSAVGAVTLSEDAKRALMDRGVSEGLAGAIGVIGVTLVIAYITLVIGELVPKRLALQRAEVVAQLAAPVLDRMASLLRPVIWLLSRSTDLVVRLLGGDPDAHREAITEEELRGLVAAHESLTKDERKLIDEVFAAGERQLREVMVPRTEVAFLDAGMTVARAAKLTASAPHSRYPVVRSSQDDVLGFVHVRDLLLLPVAQARTLKVASVTREVKQLPDSKRVLPSLSEMRREGHHLAIVVDEYGGTAGIITLEDLIEEVIGDIRDEYDVDVVGARLLRGGDLEADGLWNLDEFFEQSGVRLPDGPYETLAGYVMAGLGHVPRTGEAVEVVGHRLEVTELDGRRVSRVRITPIVNDDDREEPPV